ncbi:MAG: signal peptide peptidase SppA [Burkholderiales bacterium]|nr:signal peptide peptidase SppA [Burkholderiales bacterium]
MAQESSRPPRAARSLVLRFFAGLAALLDGTRRLLLNLLMLALIVGALAWLWQRWWHSPALAEKTTLVLELSGGIVDQARGGSARSQALAQLRGQGEAQMRLRDVLAVLDTAARDDKVTQALLLLDGLEGTGLATLREVAAALERFRATGKKVVAWGAEYNQRQYYLAAHADEVWLHPMGLVFIEGYGRYRSYYKDAFDRLGVSANVVRAGKFKNAAETYAASGPSAETVESDRALYGSLWASWIGGVERARKLPAGSVMNYVDGIPGSLQAVGGDAAQLGLKSKLVDALKTRDEMRKTLIERGAEDAKNKTFRQVSFGEYLARVEPQKGTSKSETIAVVVAQGEIVDGRAGPGLVGGLSTAEQIRKAREAEDVKAIILRVNSPGGSAFGSELVRRELELARAAGKPVVVSMGDLAASGGYWISMAADEIIADEATITGSIGVVGMIPSAEDALAKVGVRSAGTTTTWLAGAMDVKRNPDPRLVATVQSAIDHAYGHFVGMVARERKLAREQVDAVAQGRVWSGKDARARALVDRLGSWGDAVAAAQKRAKLAEGTVARLRYFEAEPGRLQKLLMGFGLREAAAAKVDARVAWLLDDSAAEAGMAAQAAQAAGMVATVGLGLVSPELAAALVADLGWLGEVAQRRRPFATATHCLCGAP